MLLMGRPKVTGSNPIESLKNTKHYQYLKSKRGGVGTKGSGGAFLCASCMESGNASWILESVGHCNQLSPAHLNQCNYVTQEHGSKVATHIYKYTIFFTNSSQRTPRCLSIVDYVWLAAAVCLSLLCFLLSLWHTPRYADEMTYALMVYTAHCTSLP
jgi:hypothetical protein